MATRLKYNVGATINLGNYQSARVDIGMEVDVSNNNVDSAMEKIKTWCDKQLAVKVEQIKKKNG